MVLIVCLATAIIVLECIIIDMDIWISDSGDGDGSRGNPYLIMDIFDLQAMKNNQKAHYALAKNINASDTINWNGGQGFEPVGTFPYGFNGFLDGRGYSITGLYINRNTSDVGLFGFISRGRVSNVGLVDVNVSGRTGIGGLVGRSHGTISNSHMSGIVIGYGQVGGIVGINYDGSVADSYATGSIYGNTSLIGGLVGENTYGSVSNSYSSGEVMGNNMTGGLVGGINKGSVTNSYATGRVTGSGNVGGLVGGNQGSVSNSFATGSVTGNGTYSGSVGGLVGGNSQEGSILNTYAIGNVTGPESIGGLVGYTRGMVTKSYSTGNVTGEINVGGLVGTSTGWVAYCFWDTQLSGLTTSAGGLGEITEKMKKIVTYLMANWTIVIVDNINEGNASSIWNIVEGRTYPFLSWEITSSDQEKKESGYGPLHICCFIHIIIAGIFLVIALGWKSKLEIDRKRMFFIRK